MPAEWEMHSATQLHWPSNRETWPGNRLQRVEKVYLEIIDALHTHEPVVLLVDPQTDYDRIKKLLIENEVDLGRVHIYRVPINDVWARDCGPVFVKKQTADKNDIHPEYVITDWDYNAWGGKYPPYDSDDRLPKWFANTFDIKSIRTNMVLEGGSIETNGDGVLLTTESVLLHPNRNPELSKKEIEDKLLTFLGMDKIVWLNKGLEGDDTDGHIDDLSRFLNRNTILTMTCDDPLDVNYAALKENLEILRNSTDQYGNPFHIVTLPLPRTKIEGSTVDGSEYVPASYANFYIANGTVLVPLYDENYDEIALDLFREFFPDREIIGISCADLVWGQGSIHCITQQLYGLNL